MTDRASDSATSECLSTSTRELAQRRSGEDEVVLLWHAAIDRVELWVRDAATGEGFHIEVPPGTAMDAFRHPYAYRPAAKALA